jgi:hypothetical protein
MAQASNPDDFALRARGIDSSSDSRWEGFDRDEDVKDEPIKIDRF